MNKYLKEFLKQGAITAPICILFGITSHSVLAGILAFLLVSFAYFADDIIRPIDIYFWWLKKEKDAKKLQNKNSSKKATKKAVPSKKTKKATKKIVKKSTKKVVKKRKKSKRSK